jgi:hypothetical protein
MLKKMPFNAVFDVSEDKSITPHFAIRVGGVVVQADTTIQPGFIIGGIDLTQYTDKDLEVEVENDVYVIRGIYK